MDPSINLKILFLNHCAEYLKHKQARSNKFEFNKNINFDIHGKSIPRLFLPCYSCINKEKI